MLTQLHQRHRKLLRWRRDNAFAKGQSGHCSTTSRPREATVAVQQKGFESQIAALTATLKAQAAQIQKVSDQLGAQARAPLVVANISPLVMVATRARIWPT